MQEIASVLKKDSIGKEVSIHGWVYRIRSSGKIAFVIVRDGSGIVQTVANAENFKHEEFNTLASLTIESSLELKGTVTEDKRAITGYEIKIKEFRIFQRNDSFPITKDQSEDFLLDIRHLWIRSREFTSVLKIRSTLFRSFADFYYRNGYYQVHTPFMVSTAAEGGSTLFKVPFFGDEVSLTQSAQFYLESLIFSLEKVFTIGPSFRAEKSRTRRHLTEYWHAEMEVAWLENEALMDIEEQMIEFMVQEVVRNNEEDLKILGRDIDKLRKITAPFERIRYGDLMKRAREEWGLNFEYGTDLGADEERELMSHFEKPIFVTHYPADQKSFYHRPDPENRKEVLCHDLLAPEGYGEIIGGGERIWELDVLEKRMEEARLNKEDYYWYTDLRKYGSIPHSGFGLGLDRVAMWVMGLQNIRDAIPYPRTIRRTKP